MRTTDKASEISSKEHERVDDVLKRLEKFGDIKPDETIWSEQRLLENVRMQFAIDRKRL